MGFLFFFILLVGGVWVGVGQEKSHPVVSDRQDAFIKIIKLVDAPVRQEAFPHISGQFILLILNLNVSAILGRIPFFSHIPFGVTNRRGSGRYKLSRNMTTGGFFRRHSPAPPSIRCHFTQSMAFQTLKGLFVRQWPILPNSAFGIRKSYP